MMTKTGPREALEQPVLEHGLGSRAALLGGLADHHQGARPVVREIDEPAGGADEIRHMYVMPAGMHDEDLLAGLLGRGDG